MITSTKRWSNGMGWDVKTSAWEAEVWAFSEITRVRLFDEIGEPWRWAEFPGCGAPLDAAVRAIQDGEVFAYWTPGRVAPPRVPIPVSEDERLAVDRWAAGCEHLRMCPRRWTS